jgi:flagellar biosynthetic protein FlhB
MADSAQERTEEATPRQLRRARERGEVARSADLTASVVLTAGLAMLAVRADDIAAAARALVGGAFGRVATASTDPAEGLAALYEALTIGGSELAPILLAMTLAALFIAWVQVGAVFSLEPLTPKLERLDPVAGLKNKYFSARAWIELVKSFAKFFLVGSIVLAIVLPETRMLLSTARADPAGAAYVLVRLLARLAAWVAMTFLALGVLDVFIQRHQYTVRQRMTKDDVKRERRDNMGDPETRAARRRFQHEIMNARPIDTVGKEAHFGARNPQHIAVALRYDPEQDSRPRIIAKGIGERADRILEELQKAGLPVLIHVPFARGCYQLEEGDEIDEELVAAAIVVMHWVEEIALEEGWIPKWRSGVMEEERSARAELAEDRAKLEGLLRKTGVVIRDAPGTVGLLADDRGAAPRFLLGAEGELAAALLKLASDLGVPVLLDGALIRELRKATPGAPVPAGIAGPAIAALELARRDLGGPR